MDDIERMINFAGELTAKVLGKEPPAREQAIFQEIDSAQDLYEAVFQLLAADAVCKAEDLLFEELRKGFTEGKYLVALEFYRSLSERTDEELTRDRFSREEIAQGLADLERFRAGK